MIIFWIIFAILVLCLILPAFTIGFIKYMTWLGKVTGITKRGESDGE